jgi:hypothetical protein
MHGPDLDYSFLLLGFEDPVAAAPRHLCYVQELGAVDHVVVWVPLVGGWDKARGGAGGVTFAPGHANAVDIDLKAETSLLLKDACSQTGSHPGWGDLPCGVHGVGDVVVLRNRRRHGRELYGLGRRVVGALRALGLSVRHAMVVVRLRIW